MNLLLDTHSFIWFIEGSPRLSATARLLISTKTNRSFLSLASVWEMAIKTSRGRIHLRQSLDILIPHELNRRNLKLLRIKLPHVMRVATLPFHHSDPFDRLIIAQALVQGLPIVSIDPAFDAYGVTRLW